MEITPPSIKDPYAPIGVIVAIIIAAFGFWFFASKLLIPLGLGPLSMPTAATSTALTAATSTTSAITSAHTTSRTALSTISRIPNTSRFRALLSSSGVTASISGKGPYTVFVPTDTAFNKLPVGTISSLTADQKKRLVQYHVVPGRAINISLQRSGTIEALSRDVLNFSFGADKVPMVNSAVVTAQYTVSNGIVYVIDNVLIPPTSNF